MSLEFFVSHVQPLLPDFIVRWVVWLYLLFFVRRLRRLDHPHKELRTVNRAKDSEFKAVADKTDAANTQHYEVPTEFFINHLGPCRKYSSCEWPAGVTTLDEAETVTFESYLAKNDMDSVPTGGRILEIGCGWGSLLLYSAQRYPHLRFVGFSNSATQIKHIRELAADRKLTNVRAVRLDINDFCAGARPVELLGDDDDDSVRSSSSGGGKAAGIRDGNLFHRVVSIECLEHSKDYHAVFRTVSSVLRDDGRCFFQILCHREYTYFMNNDDWMGRNFFTGGTIPSTKLFLFFNEHLGVDRTWYLSGKSYARTLDAWLHRMAANRTAVVRAFDASGQYPGGGALEYEKWRMFYLMSSESFGFGKGDEWMVSYFSMSKRCAPANIAVTAGCSK